MKQNAVFETIGFRGKKDQYYVIDIGYPRFNEVDAYRVVWNGHFLNYFEMARLSLCRHFDFDLEKLAEFGCFLPVHKYHLSMKKHVTQGDYMRVGVRPSLTADGLYEFFHVLLVEKEIRAYGTVQHVAMNKETGTVLTNVPQEALALLNRLGQKF